MPVPVVMHVVMRVGSVGAPEKENVAVGLLVRVVVHVPSVPVPDRAAGRHATNGSEPPRLYELSARNGRYVETETSAGFGKSSRRQIVLFRADSARARAPSSYAWVRANERSVVAIAIRASA